MKLRQKKLKAWQDRNFPRSRYEAMTKDQLIDMVCIMQMTLGMAEETGEICHHILKGTQGIRGGQGGIDVDQVVDGVADHLVFGMQALSEFGVDAESGISQVIEEVLQRDWLENPGGEREGVCQDSTKKE